MLTCSLPTAHCSPRIAHCPLLTAHCSLVQLTHSALITRRRYTEQRVATGSEPVIEDGTKFREWPNAHDRGEPLPTRQHADDFNPGEVTLVPAAVGRSHVHLLGHFLVRMWRCAIQILRVVVIQPLQPLIAIEWLNVFSRPAAQVALAVRVDFNFRLSCQG